MKHVTRKTGILTTVIFSLLLFGLLLIVKPILAALSQTGTVS